MNSMNFRHKRLSRRIVFGALATCSILWCSGEASAQSVIDMPPPKAAQTNEAAAQDTSSMTVDPGRLAITRFARGRSGPTSTYGMFDRSYRYGSYNYGYYGVGLYPFGIYPWYGGCYPHAHIAHVGGGRFVGRLHH